MMKLCIFFLNEGYKKHETKKTNNTLDAVDWPVKPATRIMDTN